MANHLPEGVNITLQSENGFIGLGPTPEEGHDGRGHGKRRRTAGDHLPGASVSTAPLLSLIRGGHVDAPRCLGLLEVNQEGNLANWMIPGKKVPGMGGAMDLVAGANLVIITMEHCNKSWRAQDPEKMHAASHCGP